MKSSILAIFCLITLFTSCNENIAPSTEKITVEKTEIFTLVGKQLKLIYPEFTAEVQYLSETALHWKTIDTNNQIAEATEDISYKQLNKSQFFVNWIEKDGITVSQILDLEKKIVTVFLSFEDNNSEKGKRGSSFFEGKIEFL